jgi:hypothetical protein
MLRLSAMPVWTIRAWEPVLLEHWTKRKGGGVNLNREICDAAETVWKPALWGLFTWMLKKSANLQTLWRMHKFCPHDVLEMIWSRWQRRNKGYWHRSGWGDRPGEPTASHKELYGKRSPGRKKWQQRGTHISGLTNVLYIDLSSQSYSYEERRDLYEKYLGGLELLQTSCLKSIKKNRSSWPEMPVILSTGPLSGVYPTCTKTVALFRSPLNGELGESYARRPPCNVHALFGIRNYCHQKVLPVYPVYVQFTTTGLHSGTPRP